MKYLKEIGLILLGALICYVVIVGNTILVRVNFLEKNVGQIAQYLNGQQPKPTPAAETPKMEQK